MIVSKLACSSLWQRWNLNRLHPHWLLPRFYFTPELRRGIRNDAVIESLALLIDRRMHAIDSFRR